MPDLYTITDSSGRVKRPYNYGPQEFAEAVARDRTADPSPVRRAPRQRTATLKKDGRRVRAVFSMEPPLGAGVAGRLAGGEANYQTEMYDMAPDSRVKRRSLLAPARAQRDRALTNSKTVWHDAEDIDRARPLNDLRGERRADSVGKAALDHLLKKARVSGAARAPRKTTRVPRLSDGQFMPAPPVMRAETAPTITLEEKPEVPGAFPFSVPDASRRSCENGVETAKVGVTVQYDEDGNYIFVEASPDDDAYNTFAYEPPPEPQPPTYEQPQYDSDGHAYIYGPVTLIEWQTTREAGKSVKPARSAKPTKPRAQGVAAYGDDAAMAHASTSYSVSDGSGWKDSVNQASARLRDMSDAGEVNGDDARKQRRAQGKTRRTLSPAYAAAAQSAFMKPLINNASVFPAIPVTIPITTPMQQVYAPQAVAAPVIIPAQPLYAQPVLPPVPSAAQQAVYAPQSAVPQQAAYATPPRTTAVVYAQRPQQMQQAQAIRQAAPPQQVQPAQVGMQVAPPLQSPQYQTRQIPLQYPAQRPPQQYPAPQSGPQQEMAQQRRGRPKPRRLSREEQLQALAQRQLQEMQTEHMQEHAQERIKVQDEQMRLMRQVQELMPNEEPDVEFERSRMQMPSLPPVLAASVLPTPPQLPTAQAQQKPGGMSYRAVPPPPQQQDARQAQQQFRQPPAPPVQLVQPVPQMAEQRPQAWTVNMGDMSGVMDSPKRLVVHNR